MIQNIIFLDFSFLLLELFVRNCSKMSMFGYHCKNTLQFKIWFLFSFVKHQFSLNFPLSQWKEWVNVISLPTLVICPSFSIIRRDDCTWFFPISIRLTVVPVGVLGRSPIWLPFPYIPLIFMQSDPITYFLIADRLINS